MEQRLEMWKLLYDLVRRNGSKIEDIVNFVDEVFGGKESLLRPDVDDDHANKVQDTFIYWLMEMLINMKNMPHGDLSDNILAKNILTQQHIIKACFENRDELFDRLMQRYFIAIQQINDIKMNALEFTAIEPMEVRFETDAFVCDTTAMGNIDGNFNFQKIQFIGVQTANCNIYAWLQTLVYGFHLGGKYQLDTFDKHFSIIHKVMLYGNYKIKNFCLKFYSAYLSYLHEAQHKQELPDHVYANILRIFKGLVSLWKYSVPKWLSNDTYTQISFTKFSKFQKNTDNILQLLKDKFPLKACFPIALEFQRYVTQVYKRLNALQPWCNSLKLNFKLMLRISKCNVAFKLSPQILAILQNWSEEEYIYTRIISVNAVNQQLEPFLKLWQHFLKTKSNKLETLQEFLINLAIIQQEALYAVTDSYKMWQYEIDRLTNLPSTQLISLIKAQKKKFKNALTEVHKNLFKSIKDSITECSILLDFQQQLQEMAGEKYAEIAALMLQFFMYPQDFPQLDLSVFSNFLLSPLKQCSDKSLTFTLQAITLNILPTSLKKTVQMSFQHVIPLILCNAQLSQIFANYVEQLWAVGGITREQILQHLLMPLLAEGDLLKFNEIGRFLQVVLCTSALNDCDILMSLEFNENLQLTQPRLQLTCSICQAFKSERPKFEAYILDNNLQDCLLPFPEEIEANEGAMLELYECLEKAEFVYEAILIDEHYLSIFSHMPVSGKFCQKVMDKMFECSTLSEVRPDILRCVYRKCEEKMGEGFVPFCSINLHGYVKDSLIMLMEDNGEVYAQQFAILQISEVVAEFATTKHLFYMTKMLMIYLMHPHSQVQQDGVQIIKQMCLKHNISIFTLWNWYKSAYINTIVRLAVEHFLIYGVRLTQSLKYIADMLDFSCVREFVCKYYRIITSILLPYCVQYPTCRGMFVSIVKMTGKALDPLLVTSFLRAYCYTHMRHTPEVAKNCLDLIVKCTHSTISELVRRDLNT